MIEDPVNSKERTQVASQCMTDLGLEMIPAVIDQMNDHANKAYKGHPDRLFLVGRDGKMAYSGAKGPFGFSPDELEAAIKVELLKVKPSK